MPRPRRKRFIQFWPRVTYFKPAGVPLATLQEIELSGDEIEAIRLKDLQGLDQEEVAKKMKVSRPTIVRILQSAHKKIAESLIKGRAIKLKKGGDVIMPRGNRTGPLGQGPMTGRGLGREVGRRRLGSMSGNQPGSGPGGNCVCPQCQTVVPHGRGVPCYEMGCPKCGTKMVKE